MEVHGRPQGRLGRQALGEKSPRDAGEDVAGPARGHSGISRRVEDGLAPRRCDHRVGALQRHGRARLPGQSASALDPGGLDLGDGATEEPRRLAGVRREQPGASRVAEVRQSVDERRERVGVEHDRPLDVAGQLPDETLGLRIEAEAGAERQGIHAEGEIQDSLARLRRHGLGAGLRKRLGHRLHEVRRHDGLLTEAGGARHEARADPERAATGEDGRPRLPQRARHHEQVTEASLVGIDGSRREKSLDVRRLEESGQESFLQPGAGDPEVGELDLAPVGQARGQVEPDLGQAEGDGQGGVDRGAQALPVLGGQPRGQVERADGLAAGVHGLDGIGDGPRRRATHTRAQEGVHDEIRLAERPAERLEGRSVRHFRQRQAAPLERGEVRGGVAADLAATRGEPDRDERAAGRQMPGDHKTVSPVLPLPGHDGHPPPVDRPEHPLDHVDGAPARILHQDEARHAVALRRPPVRPAHLVARGEADHGVASPSVRTWARARPASCVSERWSRRTPRASPIAAARPLRTRVGR